MDQRQALGIDISHWARAGGVNFAKAQQHIINGTYDFLIIKAGQGLRESDTFLEQRKGAEEKDIPHTTYYFLDPNRDLKQQAKHYVDLVGKGQPSYIVDVEYPYPESEGGRLPTRLELLSFLDELEMLTQKQPIIYSSREILHQVRFLSAAENYKLWIAWYPYDRSIYPHDKVQYNYFIDFLDDYAETRPRTVVGSNIAKNVLLWQFSEKGNGYHYIFNKRTADPRYPVGPKMADLNVSIQERDVFMQTMFGDISTIVIPPITEEVEGEEPAEPTYPNMKNQDMINLFLEASSINLYWQWIMDAQLESMAVPRENRDKFYTGPEIEDLPNLDDNEKDALLAAMTGAIDEVVDMTTYPEMGITNQDMINLFLAASSIDHYWQWIKDAQLEHMAIPEQNRNKPYTGPKVEDLPNLSQDKKDKILAEI
jgi:GH25 family lysozyme M1 (1,4-beta-N-acetylmuramidase)